MLKRGVGLPIQGKRRRRIAGKSAYGGQKGMLIYGTEKY